MLPLLSSMPGCESQWEYTHLVPACQPLKSAGHWLRKSRLQNCWAFVTDLLQNVYLPLMLVGYTLSVVAT